MASITCTRTIAVAAQDIWYVLADFGAIADWVGAVDHSCILNHGPDGSPLGTSRRIQSGRNTFVERITEFDVPRALAYTIEGLPARVRDAENRWTLKPTVSGATEVSLTSTVSIGSGALHRLAEHLLCRLLARQSQTMLSDLSRRCEAAGV